MTPSQEVEEMTLSKRHCRDFSAAVLMVAALFLIGACAGDSSPTATPAPPATAVPTAAPAETPTPATFPTATPEPTSTPAPTATPAPTPAPEAGDFLAAVAANIAGMSSATFSMADETETGALFFGTTFKSMEAVVETPSNFRMLVDVVAPGFGFVEIEIIKVGEQAVMKLSKDAPWIPMPPEQVPFNFAGLAIVFGNLPSNVQSVALKGTETLQGRETVLVEAVVPSEALTDLITSADPGNEVTITMWIDESEFELRQMRLAGQIYNDDAPETTRLITLEDINVPVEIELPDVASGQ